MAVVTLSSVEQAVRDAVGTSALLRARALARAGMVGPIRSDPSGRIHGLVLDGVHSQEVRLVPQRRPDGNLDATQAWCSCEAAMPCQHVAAVLLADSQAQTARWAGVPGKASGATPAPPVVAAWEQTLQTVLTARGGGKDLAGSAAGSLRGPVAAVDSGRARVGLQFEVVDGAGAGAGSGLRVAVRLVAPGKSGGWVRSGVSWVSLAYPDYHLGGVPTAQVRLLQEMHTLFTGQASRPGYGYGYGYGDKVLYLDDVVSRRVWDLLLEAQESGLPLVMAGKKAETVRVHPDPVVARLAVRRDGADLLVEPLLQSGSRIVGEHLPVGAPVHGIAWFPGGGAGGLQLARLAAVPPALFTRLAAAGPLRVPAAGQDCFLSTYYPELAQHVEVSCPDGSVALPAPAPPFLELTLTTLGDHRVQLDWGWIYRWGGSRRHEPLALPNGPAPPGRDPAAEARLLGSLTPLITSVPGAVQGDAGEIVPAGQAQLEGIETARLMTAVVPALQARPDVEVRIVPQAGPVLPYREVDDAPVIEFTSTAGADGVGAAEPDWFDLAVTVTVDGHQIPFDQLFVALAQEQPHLLLANGVWFSLTARSSPTWRA
jgi:hypothetical protein